MYNSLKPILFGLENSGAAETDSKIGSKARDNKIDTTIKRIIFSGSLRFNNNCPIPTKLNVIIK